MTAPLRAPLVSAADEAMLIALADVQRERDMLRRVVNRALGGVPVWDALADAARDPINADAILRLAAQGDG